MQEFIRYSVKTGTVINQEKEFYVVQYIGGSVKERLSHHKIIIKWRSGIVYIDTPFGFFGRRLK